MKRGLIAALPLVLFTAGTVFAQAGGSGGCSISDEQLGGNIVPSIRAQIRAIGDSACRAGLPAAPILNLAREYGLKRYAPNATVSRANELLDRMSRARSALGPGADTLDIIAGADALRVGIEAVSIARLRAERREEPLFVALGVATELTAAGVPRDTAVVMVLRMLGAGVRNADLMVYRQNVERDIALGNLPSAAASLRGEAVIQLITTDRDFLSRPASPGSRVPTGRPPIPPDPR